MPSDDTKEQIRQALPITEYYLRARGEQGQVSGKNIFYKCPNHKGGQEKNPSFSTLAEKPHGGKCWACDFGYADVYAVIMAWEGCDFFTAIRIASDMTGIPLDDELVSRVNTRPRPTPMPGEKKDERKAATENRPRRKSVYVVEDYDGKPNGAEHHRIDYTDGDEPRRKVWWSGCKGRDPSTFPLIGAAHVKDWPEDARVLVVEGEPAFYAAHEAGLYVVGTYGTSAVPTTDTLQPAVEGREVYLWADNDPVPDKGLLHMHRVAENAHGVAKNIGIFVWDDETARKLKAADKAPDAADHPAVISRDQEGIAALQREWDEIGSWKPEDKAKLEKEIEVRKTKERKQKEAEVAKELADAALDNVRPLRSANGGGTTTTASPIRHRTHWGNAQRLVNVHGENIRYCYQRNKWLHYDGKRWVWDEDGKVERLAKDIVNVILSEAQHASDPDERTKLIKWSLATENQRELRALVESARNEPGIPVSIEELDKDNLLINYLNGTFDVRAGQLREHRSEDFITRIIPVEYDSDAKAPLWE